jgi:hypothetical protein
MAGEAIRRLELGWTKTSAGHPSQLLKADGGLMPTRFQVSREDHSDESGWVPIGKFGSMSKAEAFAANTERGKPQYSNNNYHRLYLLIEPC